MQPLSLTPKEYWAVSKAKPDNMVLAATSWPGKILWCWKICFSFPLLLQALTQERKGRSSFAGLNQACRRWEQKWEKWRAVRRWSPVPYQVTPWHLVALAHFSDSRLQDLWILPDFRYTHNGFRYWIYPNSSQHLPFKSQLLSMASLTHLCHKQYLMWVVPVLATAAAPSKMQGQTHVVLEMTLWPLLPPLPTFSLLGTQTSARLLETTLARSDSPLPSSIRHTPQALGRHPSPTAGTHC